MAKWTGKKTSADEINGGFEYGLDDDVEISSLNSIVNNSLYASQISENVANQISSLNPSDKIEFKGSNPNILVNSDFRINQKGQTSYTINDAFTVDGWKLWYGKLEINDDGSVTHTASSTWQGIRQYITKPSRFAGKTITMSVKANSSTTRLFQISVTKFGETSTTVIGSSGVIDSGLGINSITRTLPSDLTDDDKLMFMLYTPDANQSVTWYWAKIEIGSIATDYSPKPYEQELVDCQVIEGGIATTYSNPNLLINGNFRINQRNALSVTNKYAFDRWYTTGYVVFKKNTDNIEFTSSASWQGIIQYIDKTGLKAGDKITYSVKISNSLNNSLFLSIKYRKTSDDTTSTLIKEWYPVVSDTPNIYVMSATLPDDFTDDSILRVDIWSRYENQKINIYYAKVEVGSIATPFVPIPYAEELAMCQRYYQVLRINGSMAFVANTSIIYSAVPLIHTLRNKPTITNEVQTSLREIGKGIKGNVNLDYNMLYDNILQFSIDTSSLDLTQNNAVVLVNGTITVDAEIY